MMLFSFILSVSINAMLNIGAAPSVMLLMFRSLSIPISRGLPLLAHLELIVYSRF